MTYVCRCNLQGHAILYVLMSNELILLCLSPEAHDSDAVRSSDSAF